jgi:hypothetical protein
MECDGCRFKRWMNSQLNHLATGKVLLTAYIGEDCGRDRQYFDAQMRVGQRNVIVAGCFDDNKADELVVPIFWPCPTLFRCYASEVSELGGGGATAASMDYGLTSAVDRLGLRIGWSKIAARATHDVCIRANRTFHIPHRRNPNDRSRH